MAEHPPVRVHDLLIVGAGPVGLALALALKDAGLDIVLADARAREAVARDPRDLALAHGTRLTLQRLGVWDGLPSTAIEHIHISHQGGLGRTLIDAGCELDGYASDITRTFPVSGRFSSPQRAVYELVLAAQAAAREATRPGAHWNQPHDAAVKVLAQGMLDLGLLQGSLDGVLENGDYRRFYMHRTGHWLGMDVHDAGEYKLGGEWRPLVEGMVLTIEPGCYIRPADDVPEAFWNIGIRIEDDAVVTTGGCELITEDAPKAVADIEALMRETRARTT